MKTKLLTLTMLPLLALGLLVTGCDKSDSVTHGSSQNAQKYHCPMHPNYVSDRPGDCPICNMKLVPIKDSKPAAPAPSKATSAQPGQFTCPMHPNIVSNAPGLCPECNMKLVPAEDLAEPAAPPVPGRIAIHISPDKQQLIGVRLEKVESRNLSMTVRTTATFQHDETRLAKIAPRFAGWVKDLKINYTGQTVEKGEPLLTVYSPDLLSAENEYLIAYERLAMFKGNTNSPEYASAKRMVQSSRRKLTLWQIGEEEIGELEKTGEPKDEVLLRSPVSGHVLTKNVTEGKAFMAGETLYEIADLPHLWLVAYVFESDLPLMKVGQKARVILPYLGNKTLRARSRSSTPTSTRRRAGRRSASNWTIPRHELRPDMWANVDLEASIGEGLAVPASAVIDTGERYVAFVRRRGRAPGTARGESRVQNR